MNRRHVIAAFVVSSSSGSSSQAAKYVPGVAERRNGVDRWNHAGLSNTDSQTGSSQSLAATREYDPYGNIVNSSGTFGGPFGYAGKFGYDSGEGSLQLLGNRWYDPEVGRFLSRDPAHDGGNWYAYCSNNPLTYVDPSGLLVPLLVVGGIVVVAAVVGLAGCSGPETYAAPDPGSSAAGALQTVPTATAAAMRLKEIRDAERETAEDPLDEHPNRRGDNLDNDNNWQNKKMLEGILKERYMPGATE